METVEAATAPVYRVAQTGCELGNCRVQAASSRGPWHLARSLAVQVALPNAHFDSLGLLRLSMTLGSTAGCGIRMSGGVAGVRG